MNAISYIQKNYVHNETEQLNSKRKCLKHPKIVYIDRLYIRRIAGNITVHKKKYKTRKIKTSY